jgi:hypothetical protein
MARIVPILEALRRIIARWTVTETPLTLDGQVGSDILTVNTTQRFHPGDQLMVKDGGPIGTASVNDNVENNLQVADVIDNTHLRLTTALKFKWPVARQSYAVKTIHGRFVKTIFLGEPTIIPENALPAITVSAQTSASEWYTTRATKERYSVSIGVFIEDSTDEEAALFHYDLTDLIVQGLKKNIYPLVSDYQTFPVTQDIQVGDQYIRVTDTSQFVNGNIALIEDQYKMFENHVDCVLDSTTLKMNTAVNALYLAGNTQIIKPNRFIFNSWPSDTKWGNIYKGTLLKAAVVNYFAEEIELQFNQPWSDTQLK